MIKHSGLKKMKFTLTCITILVFCLSSEAAEFPLLNGVYSASCDGNAEQSTYWVKGGNDQVIKYNINSGGNKWTKLYVEQFNISGNILSIKLKVDTGNNPATDVSDIVEVDESGLSYKILHREVNLKETIKDGKVVSTGKDVDTFKKCGPNTSAAIETLKKLQVALSDGAPAAKGEVRALAYKPSYEPSIIQRGEGLTSTEVATAKDDPNFPKSDGFSYSLGDSWTTKGGGYYSVNYCWGVKQDKPLLNGVEFSFREGTNKRSEGACNNLMIYTADLVAGKNVKGKRWNGILGGHWEGAYIDGGNTNKLEYLVLQSSDGLRYGTYLTYEPRGESDIGSRYSQGVFGPPFSTAPAMGKITYNVVIGGGWSGWGIAQLSLISVDFAKGELTIDSGLYNGGLNDREDRRSIKTNGPLKFNKENGTFKGTVTTFHSPGNGRPPVTSTGDVYGYLGGTNAEVIYAVMRLGSTPSRPGINYVIGAAVQAALPQK